jgi:EAL domain-containing protein (putative c-di-GMP-specific phosphodiesterase class I)
VSETAISRLIDRRGRCRLAYEPVADLARGVICGYEALARFPEAMSQERWATEARARGLEPDVDAFLVGSVLAARESLPDDSFLSFNIDQATLLREPVQRVLAEAGRLDRLVVELCPCAPDGEERELLAAVGRLRKAGATIAVDGVGDGHGTLRQVALLRPEFVKLDPSLVRGVDHDDARLVIVETIGHLASRLDAWVIAQGVTTVEELDALIQLRAPLAQGTLIGVTAKTLTRVGFALSSYVRERGAAATEPGALLALLERREALALDSGRAERAALFAAHPAIMHLPLLDAGRRPVAMLERAAFEHGGGPVEALLVVTPPSRVAEVARRAMLRPAATRFHPLVCCDVRGKYLGVVPVERLVDALARAHALQPATAG